MAVRVSASLLAQLRGRPCNVYSSDVRIRVTATGLDTYPDVSVVCGGEVRDAVDKNALINPVVIVEVLSPNTEEYDRGEKLSHYKTIPSLREVVFVSHREQLVEIWRREGHDDWRVDASRAGQTARLESIDCRLDVDELYRDPFNGV